ncbi:MAG: translocation/assembly module TamB domain-containing protein [Flavobacterium sp.]|nr:translocation/assembly module TamB domain-containing protein [Flavobacterium sp.]
MNKYVRKSLKILLWIIGSVVGLLLLIIILIQVPAVQNFAKDKAVTYLQDKIKTPVRIDRLDIDFPKKVVLEGVFFQDQHGDTLLLGDRLAADISLFKLLNNKLEINSIELEGIIAHIHRDSDSVFNFDYIVNAFASDTPKDTTAAAMEISLSKINLNRIRVRFDDRITKNDLAFSLNHFDTNITKFDLPNTEFTIPKISMDGLTVQLKQGELVKEIGEETEKIADSMAQRPNFRLDLGEIDFRRIAVSYDNAGTHLDTGMSLDKLFVKFNETNMKEQLIDIDKFNLAGLKGKLAIGKYKIERSEQPVANSPSTPNNWRLKLRDLKLEDIAFKFDDENSIPVASGIDYKHLDLNDFNLDAANINYSADIISGEIAQLNVSEGSGVEIQQLQTDFYYGQTNAYLKNLYLKTPQTLLRDEIIVTYPSLDALADNIAELGIDANLAGSRVGFKDVLLFAPGLRNTNPFKSNPNAIMYINGKVNGTVDNLTIPNLEISGIGSTRIAASGRITGLPDAENAYFDLAIRDFRSTSVDIAGFVPPGTIPNTLRLPAQLGLKGTFKGAISNFTTNLDVRTSSGNAKIKAAFDQRVKNRERYDADIVVDNFDVGRLIKNDSIGRISLNAKVKGTGLDPQTASATLDGKLIKAEFNGYTYNNLNLVGGIDNGAYNVNADMNDPNLTFDLAATGGFEDKFPSAKLRLNLDIADLEKLNLHAGVLKMRGKLDADFTNTNPDNLNGSLSAYHLVVATAEDQFILDSITMVAVSTAEIDSISLKSQFLRADIRGKYELTQIGTALTNSIAKYYDTAPQVAKTPTTPQEFAFELRVNDDPILTKLVPQIERLEPIDISGRYNSEGDTIVVNGSIPRLVYGSNTISGGVLNINTEADSLVVNLHIDEIENSQFLLPNTTLTANIGNNVINYDLSVRDLKEDERYAISGTLASVDGNTEINLDPNGLVLNYEQWSIDPSNLLRLGDDGIYANEFELAREGSSIKLQSQSDSPNAPLNVEFSDFEIETLTGIAQKEGEDGLAMGGTINGSTELRDMTTRPVFVADMTVENFSFRKDTVGNINIKVNNEVANTYDANVEITGQGNQVNLDGLYRADSGSFDLTLDMERLHLKSVQGFTMGNMTNSSGYLSADMKITGTTEQPNIRGKLKFNDGAFTITPLNSSFKLVNDEITFTDQGMVFNRFSLSDEQDNILSVNGWVLTQTYRDFGFDLQVRADNFRAINSTAQDNELYYGTLYLDTRLDVGGTLAEPVVNGSIKINEETDLSIVLPQSDPSIADREGIVEFIDQDNPQLTERLNVAVDSLNQSDYKGMNIAVNVEIVEEAELSLIIDKGNGDYLSLKGEGRLSGGVDPSGKTSLTGRYEITEGAYEMSFNFIRRRFEIRKGSYIQWNGEPTDALIDITAVYTANTAPIDLVGDQLPAAVRNTYKQRLPFETELKMNGELLKPEITFDIVLPEGNYGVSSEIVETSRAKLAELRQQPSELNKQVFALLLLNRFIGENPFASEAGSASAETLARQSVSKILSQQLNDLAGDLISGVELDFDLESTEDYTTGQREDRTDLNVGVSKRLLNDRLKVTVGSSFGLEGPQQENQDATNIAGDVSIDYQLTKDGRYMVRAYRKDEYQVALQGQVIETGVAFIITMDYNEFRELFHRTEEEKRQKRQQKRRERELKEKERKEAEDILKEREEKRNAEAKTETESEEVETKDKD